MTEIVCSNCSNSNPADAEICEYCGTPLVGGAAPEPVEPSPDEEPEPVEAPAEEGEVPDWLQRIREKEAGENPNSDDEPSSEDAGDELPTAEESTPALVPDEDDEELLLDEDFLEDPEWLEEIEPDEASGEPKEPQPDDSGISQATLPSWVEAMRPVDTFRTVVEPEDQDEMAVESVGPLAGLRGVLLAEPVVAMPRTSAVGSMQLDVTERQYGQAEMLQAMVEQEQLEPGAEGATKTRLPLMRWVISTLVLVGVALPAILGSPTFAPPRWAPRDFKPLVEQVDQLPTDKPVLLVFDYEPAYSGELETVSSALIEQMAALGIPLSSMSTRPAGVPLAEVVLVDVVEKQGYEPGEDYVNLGYLSGGSIAVQVFAERPREAILQGYALPESLEEAGVTVWDSPVLEGVDSLDDFGMVVVITAGTETARVWVEQTDQFIGDTPLVMVVSAGAEPLVRPYFESEDPQVDGILTGIPTAYAHEVRNGVGGLAQLLWNSFGSGILIANLVLIGGVIYGGYSWWSSRRED